MGSGFALTGLRVLLGLMWLYNVSWKRPPDFGQQDDSGLFHYATYAVSDPVLAPYSWVVEHLVLPRLEVFGWLVLLVELGLAVALLTGTCVRAAAMLGVAQSAAIGLAVAFAPAEWPWSYWLMIGAHAALLTGQARRHLSVDAVRAGRSPQLLGFAWATICTVVGLAATIGAWGTWFGGPAYRFGSTPWSISLGDYNATGGLALIVAGSLLATGSLSGPQSGNRIGTVARTGALAVAAVAALVSLAQIAVGSTPTFGASATSVGLLLSAAVVAAASLLHSGPGARQQEATPPEAAVTRP